jgi:hypothetical protein
VISGLQPEHRWIANNDPQMMTNLPGGQILIPSRGIRKILKFAEAVNPLDDTRVLPHRASEFV